MSFSGGVDSSAYGDQETGHICWVAQEMEAFEEPLDDIETSDRYLMLPNKRDLEPGRSLAFSFAEECLPNEYENAVDCFRKKDAYARLKDLLDRHYVLAQWHAYEAKQTKGALRNWCRQSANQRGDPPEI